MLSFRKKIRSIFFIVWSVNHLQSILFLLIFVCNSSIYSFAIDTITINNFLSDDKGDTLVSEGQRFVLGFFTPNGSFDGRRYVGIWYYKSNPQTVVWVANRENPLSDTGGAFAIAEDGNLKVLDANGKSYWWTSLEQSSSLHKTVKLMDNGNLVLSDEEQVNQTVKILWQSFDNPTDTFLPGMKMDENLVLISWRSNNDPAPGNFTFQQDDGGENKFIIWKRSIRYWKSSLIGNFAGSGQMPSSISFLLSNFTLKISSNNSSPFLRSALYINTRLIMSYSGQVQYLKLDTERTWSLVWEEPRDRCSVYNACGNFGSCNSKYDPMCKCLPGFKPNSLDNWKSGDYSGGCSRKSNVCGESAMSDTFLSSNMMKVGTPDSQFNAKNEMECKIECLNNCHCTAYSYEEGDTARRGNTGNAVCWIWSEDLNNLQEEYENGQSLHVRVAVSDIESTKRNCGTCGTNLVPYPLSTGPKCGDPMYFNFNCNISTDQVNFETPEGTYQVTSINPETRTFIIQTRDAVKCEQQRIRGKLLPLNQSSPFQLTGWCNSNPDFFSFDAPLRGGEEVEIIWEPPLEPLCSSSIECTDWPNSSCNATRDGKKRCLCNTNFQWDRFNLNCSQDGGYGRETDAHSRGKISSSHIVAVTLTTIIFLIILSSSIIYIYFWRRRLTRIQESRSNIQKSSGINLYDSERHVKDLIESGRFKEEDAKGIDIPHFHLESILAATDNFSNANKLGQGGFGPVYKGKFPGEQEIAVKRLSSCSGQGLEEFKNEVVLIAKLQHRNLVRLLGYCVEGEEKMLIYEYMPNKSLDFFIFDRKLCVLLDWEMRFNIILGIARGLLYLHQDSRLRIIHRDLKTSNILLDEEMNPKISDFGLARIFGGKETAANTNRVVGTYGYMSPEYALDGIFSVKSDVFSFGVVVLEIMGGKRNTGFYHVEHSLSLLGYAWHLWKEDKAVELMDQILCKTCNTNDYLKCINVGLLCVQEDPNDRPTMSNILFMLGSESSTLPTPKPPAFVVRRCPSSRASSSTKPESWSQNELTVTLEDGR
ncbi:G-type lectin S-receptor-like serine/threonine-protein kinase [Quillaja saponaria]|uniref:non-specific serine/threonine protein kinase n=1 Tax=Quillaja saponaria TaxID=32244 RepID=A0AAD7PAL2_QUISA|nr:G-type lectin S-receptor-like serine/threonine-protein kinase [Quillaja saponaria]